MATLTTFPITIKQIADLTAAASAAGTDYLLAQQGATGTAYRKMTVAQVMGSGAAVLASRVTVNAATVPANGMYLAAANTIGWAANTTQILTGTTTVIAVKPTTASTSSTTGALTVAGGLGVVGTLYTGGSVRSAASVNSYWGTDGQISIGSDGIEIGLSGRSGSGTPFVDFHSSAASPDYDARIIASGGTASNGEAVLTTYASNIAVRGVGTQGLLTVYTASNGSTGTATPSGIVISDSSSGSAWDIVNPWAKLEFYTADISTGGPGGRIRIGPVAESNLGGASRLAIFQAATANTWAEKWALTSAGRMLVGGVPTDDGVHTIQATGSVALNLNATTAPSNLSGTVFRATQVDASAAYMVLDTFAGQGYLLFRKAFGTNAAPTALGDNTTFGSISARGYDGTAYSGERARISLRSDEAWSSTAHGTAIYFATTTVGTTTLVERLAIDSAGSIIFGSSGNYITIAPNTSSSTASTITGNGSGGIGIGTTGGTQLHVTNTASAVNYLTITGASSGGPTIGAAGSSADVSINLVPKGAGSVLASAKIAVNANPSSAPTPPATTLLHVTSTDATTTFAVIDTFGASPTFLGRRANGTNASKTALANGDTIVRFGAYGYGATTYSSGVCATMSMRAIETWTDTAQGAEIVFATVTTGSVATAVERLTITDSVVKFGPSGNTLSVTASTTGSTAIAITGGSTGGMTLGTSGGVQLAVQHAATAVNYVGVKGGATGTGVTVSAAGGDPDINLILDAKGTGIISALDSINLASGKVLQVNGTQVVGPRDTGWTAMTGSSNEATAYDTSTVTLAQLAGRVMAIQAALTTHGLIGA